MILCPNIKIFFSICQFHIKIFYKILVALCNHFFSPCLTLTNTSKARNTCAISNTLFLVVPETKCQGLFSTPYISLHEKSHCRFLHNGYKVMFYSLLITGNLMPKLKVSRHLLSIIYITPVLIRLVS